MRRPHALQVGPLCAIACMLVGANARASLDDEPTLALPESTESSLPAAAASDPWEMLRRGTRLTVGHAVGWQLGNRAGVISDRLSARLEWAGGITPWLFAAFDGKAFVFLPDDHRASSNGGVRLFATLREGYLQTSFSQTSIRLGRQVIVWGESEGANITDVISPRDYTEFLFPTVEDSRLGVFALTVDHYTEMGTFSVVVVPESRSDRLPEAGSAYVLTPPTSSHATLDEGDWTWRDSEMGARWSRTIGKADIGLMVASVLDNQPVLLAKPSAGDAATPPGTTAVRERQRRYEIAGATGSLVVGGWVMRAEIAYERQRAYQTRDLSASLRDGAAASVAAEYVFGNSTMVFVEAGVRHIFAWQESITTARDTNPSAAAGLMRSFLGDTVDVFLLSVALPREETVLLKTYVTYDLDERAALVIDGGLLLIGDTGPFVPLRNKHRINARLELSF